MQEFKKSEAKQRLFNDFNAGKVRFIIGSSDTMGTGVNVQLRLKALHHLDVPWLPSQIEQREGRIVRQGNQHDEVDIFAYATLGSLDATMWQNNERKARFIAAALSGDISVRRLEDLGEGQANQFAMAKAIASGDPRLMQKAGLEAEIARLERLRAAHIDDQHAIRRQIRDAEREIERATRRISEIGQDIERFVPTAGEAFAMTVMGTAFAERKPAGRALMQEVLALLHLQHEKETVIASIGGFDLVFVGQRLGRDGYHYTTLLRRTGAEFEIELPVTVTPLGAIARLEHACPTSRASRRPTGTGSPTRANASTPMARGSGGLRVRRRARSEAIGACSARNRTRRDERGRKKGSRRSTPHRGVIEGRRESPRRAVGAAPLALNRPPRDPGRGALARRSVTPRSRLPGRDARRQLRRPARPAGRWGSSERRR